MTDKILPLAISCRVSISLQMRVEVFFKFEKSFLLNIGVVIYKADFKVFGGLDEFFL